MKLPRINAVLAAIAVLRARVPRKVAVLAAVIASALAIAIVGGSMMGSAGPLHARENGEDPLADFKNRSPGARLAAIATKRANASRRQRAAARAGEPPQERALGKIFDAPEADYGSGPLLSEGPLSAFAMPDVFDVSGEPLMAGGPSTTGAGPGYGGGSGPYLIVPGSGGGPPPGSAIPTIPAVPEPRAWALLLIGFAGVGIALRRRPGRPRRAHCP